MQDSLNVLTASNEQLQTRKEEVQHLLGVVPKHDERERIHLKDALAVLYTHYSPSEEWDTLCCEWHDIDEEQETRRYYQEHPEECRACYTQKFCAVHLHE